MEYVENKELEQKEIKGIFTDMLKYAPSKLCGMFGNVITVPVYTSLFTTEEYGLYTVSIALLSFLCIIFSDWVGLAGLRFFRHHEMLDDLPKYLTMITTLLVVNMCLMFGLALLFRGGLFKLFHIPFEYLMFVLILIIPVAIRALLSQILRAKLKAGSYSLATIVNQFATIFLAYFFAKYFNLGAASILLGMGVSISLIDVLLLYQCDIIKIFKFQKIEWKFLLPIIKYGVPVAATSLSAWLITQSNRLVMNGISGFSKAALVGVGYGMTLPILMTLFAMITVAAIPRIYKMYEAKIDVRPVISKFLGYYILVSLPLITAMSLYSYDYMVFLNTNPNFYEAVALVPYFAFGVFFLAMTDYTTLQYHLANKTHIELQLKIISGVVCVGLNIILIPRLGLIGVGIATFAANFLYWLLSVIYVLPDFKLKIPKHTILRMLYSAIPTFCMYYCLNHYSNVSGFMKMIGLLIVFYAIYIVLKMNYYRNPD